MSNINESDLSFNYINLKKNDPKFGNKLYNKGLSTYYLSKNIKKSTYLPWSNLNDYSMVKYRRIENLKKRYP